MNKSGVQITGMRYAAAGENLRCDSTDKFAQNSCIEFSLRPGRHDLVGRQLELKTFLRHRKNTILFGYGRRGDFDFVERLYGEVDQCDLRTLRERLVP